MPAFRGVGDKPARIDYNSHVGCQEIISQSSGRIEDHEIIINREFNF